MKGLVILFIIGVIGCVVTVWIVHYMGTDKGTLIGVAFDSARSDSIEIHWAVPMGMLKVEGPRVDEGKTVTRKDGSTYQVPARVHWDEWVTEHFQLRDSSGKTVELSRKSYSKQFDGAKGYSLVEFFLVGKLTPGREYKLDYKPKRAEAKCYRRALAAPKGDTKAKRLTFEPVEG